MANTKFDARQSVLRSALGMVGSSANDSLDTVFPKIDAELAKLFEDRNILLTDGGTITFTGTQLQFTENLNIAINQKISGAVPQVISLGSSTLTLAASGAMIYATLNRAAGTATVTSVAAGGSLPSATSANQEIFLIAKRVDAGDGTRRVYFRNGFSLSAGQTARIGQGGTVFASEFVIVDSTDTTKKLIASLSGSTTGKTLTLASIITNNRTLTFPDITDTLVSRTNTEALSNKQVSYSSANDASTGGNSTLGSFSTGIIRLTSGSLASISGIPAGISGQYLILENHTGVSVTINNEEGTASAANRIVTGTGGNVSLLNNASFSFVYDTAQARWLVVGGTGSGSGSGSKNYISSYTASTGSGALNPGNGNFEGGSTSGFSLAHVAFSTSDGYFKPTGVASAGTPFSSAAGGSAASGNLSLSVVSSGQLAGSYSGNYASSAASVQGDLLITDAFYVDKEDQNKVLTGKFSYNVNSGAANLNFSGTSSNSFAVWIYDVTNATWIQPAGVYNLVQSFGSGECIVTFQTTGNGTRYQLALININASGGAYSFYLDDFFAGPQTTARGPAISDWAGYTPTFGGLGSVSGVNISSRRVGDTLEVSGTFTTGTTTGSLASMSLPPGLSIDTSKLSGPSSNQILGYGNRMIGSSVNFLDILASPSLSSTNVYFSVEVTGSIGTNIPQPGTNFGNNELEHVKFSVPITGWSSNSVMSNDTDTRVVTARLTQSANLSVTSSTTIVLPVVAYDSHGAYNASTGVYTVPVSGYYRVTLGYRADGSGADYFLFKNGVNVSGRLTSGSLAGYFELFCNAGDTLTIEADASVTWVYTANSGTTGAAGNLIISRISGPTTIAASETVKAVYFASSGSFTPGANVPIDFDTKIVDSHGSVTTGAGVWKFTAPVSGFYLISAVVAWAGIPQGNMIHLYKNGADYAWLTGTLGNTAGNNTVVTGTIGVQLNAGETMDLRDSGASSLSGGSAPMMTYVTIVKQGN